jgi:hypothetical protein
MMADDPHGTKNIAVGTPVRAYDGSLLGYVRDVHPHFLLVGQEGQHTDLEVPVHAIRGYVDGQLQVSVNREAVTEVDDSETSHRLGEN